MSGVPAVPIRVAAGLFVFAAFAAGPARAADTTELLKAAAADVKADRLDAALDRWLELERGGLVNEDLFYNIGTVYLRKRDVGRGVLYLERALKLAPGHADARANLTWAHKKLVDDVVHDKAAAGGLDVGGWAAALPAGLIAALLFVVHMIAGLLVLGAVFVSRARSVVAGLAAGFIALDAGLYALRELRLAAVDEQREAVIVAAAADVREGPDAGFPAVFQVHGGLKVRLDAEVEGFARVRLANGLVGYVARAALEPL